MNRTEAVIIDLTSSGERRTSVQADSPPSSNQAHYREVSMVQLQAPQADWVASPDLFDEMEPYLKSKKNNNNPRYLLSSMDHFS
ncbi:hypothetical protein BGX33_003498 [Mortierella sp. NVP41]|nr:hypothetical protein BGX33_003498 [Mortierella sp. NVP41]